MDAVDGGNYQFQIGKECGNFVDAYIKSKCAETQLGKMLPLWLMSAMDAADGGNNQFQIQKKCGNFVDAFIKSYSC